MAHLEIKHLLLAAGEEPAIPASAQEVRCYGCAANRPMKVIDGITYHDWEGVPGQTSTGSLALSPCVRALAPAPAAETEGK